MTGKRPPAEKPRLWALQDAKAQFSEVVRQAIEAGPQHVTRSGDDAVVVLSARDYAKLAGRSGRSLAAFLAASPLAAITLDVPRPHGRGVR